MKTVLNPKLLCIYLPQFHVIPENDEWWGEGFTEWTNVKRGRPFYDGHYQPREPLNDNYYDLSDCQVLEKHVKMAKKAGIYGFCFYHYWFKGKKLLEKPVEDFRDKSKEQFPYCLIWANESWTRTWYRAKIGNQMLLRQMYGTADDWEKQFYYLLDFFKDERYIKVDNKPVYIIYLPQKINNRREMFALWERLARENGFDGLYLIAMITYAGGDKKKELYSAYMNFEPSHLLCYENSWRRHVLNWKRKHIEKIDIENPGFRNWIYMSNIYSYHYLCRKIEQREKMGNKGTFPCVFSGWDNTCRKDEEGYLVWGSSPAKFENHLKKMLELTAKNDKEFIFLNAWNEWSEGAYIEPDKKYGYGYLSALKRGRKVYEMNYGNEERT